MYPEECTRTSYTGYKCPHIIYTLARSNTVKFTFSSGQLDKIQPELFVPHLSLCFTHFLFYPPYHLCINVDEK